MPPLQLALQIIALLEVVEPGVQKGVMSIVSLWQTGGSVPVILEGEVTSLDAIIAKARVEQGLPAVKPVVDPDPTPLLPAA
jgi:hypothetical protein